MTSTNIKNNITEHVINKTANKSISNIELGNDMKTIVDYVDQEVKTKIVKTTISEAQILQLFTTPIVILDSSDIGKIKTPISFHIKRNAGTAYITSSSFKIVADSLATIATLSSSIMNNNAAGFVQLSGTVQVNSSSQERVNLYKIKLDSDPTGGTGSIDVYVTYIEITL